MESLDKRTTALYSAGSIGAGAFFAFNNFVLPTILKGAGAPDLLTGLLSSTRSIEGVVIQPTVGAVSDRIWTPHLGRRRIFIAVGIPLSAFFFVIAGFFTHTLLGLANVHLIHANDSKFPLASRVDRHAHIGEGELGDEQPFFIEGCQRDWDALPRPDGPAHSRH